VHAVFRSDARAQQDGLNVFVPKIYVKLPQPAIVEPGIIHELQNVEEAIDPATTEKLSMLQNESLSRGLSLVTRGTLYCLTA